MNFRTDQYGGCFKTHEVRRGGLTNCGKNAGKNFAVSGTHQRGEALPGGIDRAEAAKIAARAGAAGADAIT